MRFRVKLNPLLAYLLKQTHVNFIGEIMPIFGLWIASIPLLLILQGSYFLNLNVLLGIVVWCLSYILLMLVPSAVAYYCASATSRSIASQDYELLTLTNISDSTILWSYVAATLYRLRLLLIVAIGFAPIIFMMLSIAWTGSQRKFNGGLCVTTPLGNTYCGAVTVESIPTMGEKIAIALQVSGTLLLLAALTAGTTIVMAFAGATLGFWQRNRLMALVSAGVLAIAVSVLISIVIVPELALQTFIEPAFDPLLLVLTLILTLLPYLVVFEMIRRASTLVRRPA